MAENLPICMIRRHLDDIPRYELPPSFTIRPYRPGDEAAWERIHREADKYNLITPTLFAEQFGADPHLLVERQFYLCAATGEAIGTATAWFGDYQGQSYGRVHWVAINPAFQGRGLAKPLLAVICTRLRQLGYQTAYLTTDAARLPAINLYLKFGFIPAIQNEQDALAWGRVGAQLGRSLPSS